MILILRFRFAGGLWAVGLQWEEGQTEPPPAADDAGEAPEEEYDGEEPYAEEEAAAGGGSDAGVEEAKSSSPAEEEGEEDNGGNSNSNSNNNSNANSGMFAVDHQLGNTATKGRRKSTKKEEPKAPKPATVPQENRLYNQAKQSERRLSAQREKVRPL